jgi:hypothetical protein
VTGDESFGQATLLVVKEARKMMELALPGEDLKPDHVN